MAVRPIIYDPDPILYKKCHPVTKFDKKLGNILTDMTQTMIHANGVGLAGPQIGYMRRVCVVLDTLDNDKIIEMVNPEVVATEGERPVRKAASAFQINSVWLPGPRIVTVRAQDRNGEWFTVQSHDLTARAFLHEIDHLDGHVFTEKVTEYINMDEEEDEVE